MNWLSALDKLFKAKDLNDAIDDAKKLRGYAKKLKKKDPEKSYRDTLKYFGNDQIDDATAAFRKAAATADVVLSAKMVWPRSGTVPPFSYLWKTVDKHGHDSKKTKAATRKWIESLYSYEKNLALEMAKIVAVQLWLSKLIPKAKAVDAYAGALQKAFLTVAKIPNITSATNYEFFQWSEDCLYLSSAARTVHSKLKKIEKRNKRLFHDGVDLIKTNRLWIKWAKNEASISANSLKKNRKATKPKR